MPDADPGSGTWRLYLPVLLLAAAIGSHALAEAPGAEAPGAETPGSGIQAAQPVTSAAAKTPSVEIEQIAIGFRGWYRIGHWLPIRVTIRSAVEQSVTLVVELPDGDDLPVEFRGSTVVAGAGQSVTLETVAQTARQSGTLLVRLIDAQGQTLAARRFLPELDDVDAAVSATATPESHPHADRGASAAEAATARGAGSRSGLKFGLRHDALVWATLGEPGGLTPDASVAANRTLVPRSDRDQSRVPLIVGLESGLELPTDVRGYDVIEGLIVGTAPQAAGQKTSLDALTDRQWQALEAWVRQGGHLVLSVGIAVEEVARLPLASWLPIELKSQGSLRQFTRLEAFAGAAIPIRFAGTVPRAMLGKYDGVALMEDQSGPLAVRSAVGFGLVTLLAVDLNRPPLSGWKPVTDLARKLVQPPLAPLQNAGKSSGALTFGISDLGSQLLTAIEVIPEVYRPSFWVVLGLIFLVLLVTGPIDYLLVNRLLRRPALTWITFPAWLLIAATVAVWLGSRWNGQPTQFRQLNLLDLDAASGGLRSQSWTVLYGAQSQRYSFDVRPVVPGEAASDHSIQSSLCWLSEPESSPGGMYRQSGLAGSRASYSLSPGSEAAGGEVGVSRLPLPQWSTKAFRSSWQTDLKGLVESKLESTGPGRLRGSLQHHFPVPIDNVIVVYQSRIYFPRGRQRAIAPFQDWEPGGPLTQQRDLRGFLTGTSAQRVELSKSRSEIQFRTQPYDPASTNLTDLVRMLTFHEGAGGRTYTGLAHELWTAVELSPLLAVDRAILVGEVQLPVNQLSLRSGDDSTSQPVKTTESTFVRLVLPVKKVQLDEKFMPADELNKLEP